MPTDAPSERTQVHRLPERGVYDRDVIEPGTPDPDPQLPAGIDPPPYATDYRR